MQAVENCALQRRKKEKKEGRKESIKVFVSYVVDCVLNSFWRQSGRKLSTQTHMYR